MEIKLYLRMLQKNWIMVLITTLVTFNAALIFSYVATPTYRASARFTVSPSTQIISATDMVNSLEALDKRSIISTYAEFLNSPRIHNETIQDLQLDPLKINETYEITTVVLPDANILELTVSGPSPEMTALLANQVGNKAVETITQYYQAYEINILDPAIVPIQPISPQPVRDSALALALGLILGAGLAIIQEEMRVPLDAYRLRRSIDPVSAAYNRSYFMRCMEDELMKNEGNLSLGLVQVNGLRGLIDTLPQPIVQQIMRHVTNTLKKELRGNDIIGKWNDINFSVMLSTTPKIPAQRTMERIRSALNAPVEIEHYNETLYLHPVVSSATQEANETASDIISLAERELEKAHLHS
jgi:diguanylate cyclase (GGDEF)-like protein